VKRLLLKQCVYKSKIYAFADHLASILLCLTVASLLTFPIHPSARAGSSSIAAQELSEAQREAEIQLERVFKSSTTLLDHAAFKGTLSVGPIDVSSLSPLVNRLEISLLKAKAALENWYKSSAAQAPNPSQNVEARIISLMQYQSGVANLFKARFTLGMKVQERTITRFGLGIPLSSLKQLVGIDEMGGDVLDAKGILMDPNSMIRVDPLSIQGKSISPDTLIRLALNPSFIQGVGSQTTALHPTQANFLKLVKYQATQKLLENVSEMILYLGNDPEHLLPTMPSQLKKDLGFLGKRDPVTQTILQTEEEILFRTQLSRAFESTALAQAPYITHKFMKDLMVAAVGKTIAARAEDDGRLQKAYDAYKDIERSSIQEDLEANLQDYPFPITRLSPQDRNTVLRNILSDSTINALLVKMIPESPHIAYTSDRQRQIIALVEEKDKAYRAELSDALINQWVHRATKIRGVRDYREKYVAGLIEESKKVVQATGENFEKQEVNYDLLTQALTITGDLTDINTPSESDKLDPEYRPP